MNALTEEFVPLSGQVFLSFDVFNYLSGHIFLPVNCTVREASCAV